MATVGALRQTTSVQISGFKSLSVKVGLCLGPISTYIRERMDPSAPGPNWQFSTTVLYVWTMLGYLKEEGALTGTLLSRVRVSSASLGDATLRHNV